MVMRARRNFSWFSIQMQKPQSDIAETSIKIILSKLPFSSSNNADSLTFSSICSLIKDTSLFQIVSPDAAIIGTWIAKMNSLLRSAQTPHRLQACQLIALSSQAHPLLFHSALDSWTAGLMVLIQRGDSAILPYAIRALNIIWVNAEDRPELIREVISPQLTKYLSMLLSLSKSSEECTPAILAAITCMAKSFPTMLRPIQARLASITEAMVVSGHPKWSRLAANALVAVTRVGSPALTSSDAWSGLVAKCLGSIHELLDIVYSGVEEESNYDTSSMPKLQKGKEHSEELNHQAGVLLIPLALSKLEHLVYFFTRLLGQKLSFSAQIPLDSILELVSRMVAVNSFSVFREGGSKSFALLSLSFLPVLYDLALDILKVTIRRGKGHLLRYTSLLATISEKLLLSSRKCSKLRIKVYNIIKESILLLGLGYSRKMISIIVKEWKLDFQDLEKECEFEKPPSPNPKASSRQSKKRKVGDVANALTLQKPPKACPTLSLIHRAGLEAVSLLFCFSKFICHEDRIALDSNLLKLLMSYTTSNSSDQQNMSLCIAAIFNCLYESISHPPSTSKSPGSVKVAPSILPHVLRLMEWNSLNGDSKARLVWLVGASKCDSIIHGRVPTFQSMYKGVSIENEDENEASSENVIYREVVSAPSVHTQVQKSPETKKMQPSPVAMETDPIEMTKKTESVVPSSFKCYNIEKFSNDVDVDKVGGEKNESAPLPFVKENETIISSAHMEFTNEYLCEVPSTATSVVEQCEKLDSLLSKQDELTMPLISKSKEAEDGEDIPDIDMSGEPSDTESN